MGKKRNTMLNVALWIILGVILIGVVGYYVTFFIGLSFPLPPTAFWLTGWSIVFYISIGLFGANAIIRSYDLGLGFLDLAVLSTAFMFVGTILNLLYVVYSGSLWAGCVVSARSLDDAEQLQCDNEQWILWIHSVWSIGYAILGAIGLLATSVDAVLKFEVPKKLNGSRLKRYAAKAKGLPGVSRLPGVNEHMPPQMAYGAGQNVYFRGSADGGMYGHI
jgi:hypothetical protein